MILMEDKFDVKETHRELPGKTARKLMQSMLLVTRCEYSQSCRDITMF